MAVTNLRKYLPEQLHKVGVNKVAQLKASIDRRNFSDLGSLRASINYKITINSNSDFRIDFFWKNYGDFLNQGRNNLGKLNNTANDRLAAWVRRKLDTDAFRDKYYKTKSGKTSKVSKFFLSKRIAYIIQRNWSRGKRFPSVASGSKGWASTAFSSTERATLRRLTQTALSTAFSKYVKESLRNVGKKKQ